MKKIVYKKIYLLNLPQLELRNHKAIAPVIQSGEVTILLDLNSAKSILHDNQVKITTLNENVFVSNIIMGQSK